MRRFRINPRRLAPIFLLLLVSPWAGAADPEGQADLDAATSLKLGASSMADLERVIELTESAIEKGLDEENEELAKSLVTATLFQHGSRFAQALFDPRERTERPAMLKQFALKDLYAILEYDETLPQVYMMIARLEGVNVGQRDDKERVERGIDAADKAIALLEDDKAMQSKALVLRANYTNIDSKERIEILDRAIDVDESNTDAWRLRGKSRLVKGEMLAANGKLDEAKIVREKAISDFMALLEVNQDDPDALQSAAELLGRLGDFDKAMEFANQAIAQNPGAFTTYLLRARLNHKQKEYDAAIKDLNEAVDIKPANYLAYLDRAEVYFDSGDKKSAAKDYGKARELQGNNLPTIVIRRMSIRAQGSVENGIAEIKEFMDLDELNAESSGRKMDPDYRLHLSAIYERQGQLLDVIEILSPLINSQTGEANDVREKKARFGARDRRANCYLSIGEHGKAVDDYGVARNIDPGNPGVLNNLAWVLCTSPEDDVRDAKLAIEYATKACEATKFRAAHIISTLAASYAESGDFETAKKHSAQAVELAEAAEGELRDEEIIKQLKAELESYENEKPWREKQNMLEEKKESDSDQVAGSPEEDSADEASLEDPPSEDTSSDSDDAESAESESEEKNLEPASVE